MPMNNSEFRNEKGWPACALSLDRANLVSDFKLHYAAPAELAENGGICSACRARVTKKNGSFKSYDEQPVDLAPRHELLDLEHGHAAFTASGEIEQTTDFDYAEVDRVTQDHFFDLDQDTRHEAADAFSMILSWIWERGFVVAQKRWCVVTAGLRPELLDNEGFPQIAAKLGTTKQALSKAMVTFQTKFRIKFARGRSEAARRNMSKAMEGHRYWSTAKKNKPAPATPSMP